MLHVAVFAAAMCAGYVSADGTLPGRVAAAWYDEAAAILLHNVGFVVVLFTVSLATCGVAGCALLAINGLAFGRVLGMVTPAEKVWWVVLYAPVEVLSYTCISMAAVRVSVLVFRWLQSDSAVALGPVSRQVAAGLYGVAIAAWLEAWAIVGAWA